LILSLQNGGVGILVQPKGQKNPLEIGSLHTSPCLLLGAITSNSELTLTGCEICFSSVLMHRSCAFIVRRGSDVTIPNNQTNKITQLRTHCLKKIFFILLVNIKLIIFFKLFLLQAFPFAIFGESNPVESAFKSQTIGSAYMDMVVVTVIFGYFMHSCIQSFLH
jgi:hypothetical protein